ncbi:MAG: hypothetical protein PHP59_04330 [Methanofollis sp.]|uniref:hypothetical protein n=1 Tax=Methanofollis sp. TaxID=2052835 RepID=UPI002629F56D|nr:hypothetical protein [Methanofollis sp.]MDD4254586.1 hypothetical protein [Methanofollis sp.]
MRRGRGAGRIVPADEVAGKDEGEEVQGRRKEEGIDEGEKEGRPDEDEGDLPRRRGEVGPLQEDAAPARSAARSK